MKISGKSNNKALLNDIEVRNNLLHGEIDISPCQITKPNQADSLTSENKLKGIIKSKKTLQTRRHNDNGINSFSCQVVREQCSFRRTVGKSRQSYPDNHHRVQQRIASLRFTVAKAKYQRLAISRRIQAMRNRINDARNTGRNKSIRDDPAVEDTALSNKELLIGGVVQARGVVDGSLDASNNRPLAMLPKGLVLDIEKEQLDKRRAIQVFGHAVNKSELMKMRCYARKNKANAAKSQNGNKAKAVKARLKRCIVTSHSTAENNLVVCGNNVWKNIPRLRRNSKISTTTQPIAKERIPGVVVSSSNPPKDSSQTSTLNRDLPIPSTYCSQSTSGQSPHLVDDPNYSSEQVIASHATSDRPINSQPSMPSLLVNLPLPSPDRLQKPLSQNSQHMLDLQTSQSQLDQVICKAEAKLCKLREYKEKKQLNYNLLKQQQQQQNSQDMESSRRKILKVDNQIQTTENLIAKIRENIEKFNPKTATDVSHI